MLLVQASANYAVGGALGVRIVGGFYGEPHEDSALKHLPPDLEACARSVSGISWISKDFSFQLALVSLGYGNVPVPQPTSQLCYLLLPEHHTHVLPRDLHSLLFLPLATPSDQPASHNYVFSLLSGQVPGRTTRLQTFHPCLYGSDLSGRPARKQSMYAWGPNPISSCTCMEASSMWVVRSWLSWPGAAAEHARQLIG